MSISLNDHESRIKSLENLSQQNDIQIDRLFEGVMGTGTIQLPKPLSYYDLIYTDCGDASYLMPNLYVVKYWKKSTFNGSYSIGHVSAEWIITFDPSTIDSTSLKINYAQARIYQIVGIKFSKVILYNFSYIIKSISKFTSSILSRRRCESRDVY